MNISTFHETLERAGVDALEQVIDWIERPWEPARNDALRASWHEARRDAAAKGALLGAIEREIVDMRPAETRYVARTLGCASRSPSSADVLRAITIRLEAPRQSAPVRLDLGLLVEPMIEVAGRVLRAALREERGHHHRSGGRRRHGR